MPAGRFGTVSPLPELSSDLIQPSRAHDTHTEGLEEFHQAPFIRSHPAPSFRASSEPCEVHGAGQSSLGHWESGRRWDWLSNTQR